LPICKISPRPLTPNAEADNLASNYDEKQKKNKQCRNTNIIRYKVLKVVKILYPSVKDQNQGHRKPLNCILLQHTFSNCMIF